jgi:hypothetical protein
MGKWLKMIGKDNIDNLYKNTPASADFTVAGTRCNPCLITVPNIFFQFINLPALKYICRDYLFSRNSFLVSQHYVVVIRVTNRFRK